MNSSARRMTMTLSRRAALLASAVLIASLGAPALAGAEVPPDDAAEHILVRWDPQSSDADRASGRDAVGATKVQEIRQLGVEVLRVRGGATDHALRSLQRNPHVDYAEPDGVVVADDVVPNDPQWPNQWGLGKVNGPAAWSTTTGTSAVTVAVLDSGVDTSHPDLQGALLPGYDFVNNDNDPSDDHGHGTKSTGVVAARTNNQKGVAGTCWTCAILPVKVLNSSASGSWSGVANGITWATDQGADVISMSLSGSSASSTLHSAVRYAADRGVVLVASAGNVGDTAVRYPSGFEEVIAVAGSDSKDNRYSWSTHGSWVDVAAPGCNPTTAVGGSYGSFCGTSSSTPMVAGVAGLLLSAQPSATATEVRSVLNQTAAPVSYVASGRIDAGAAMAAVAVAPSPTTSSEPEPDPTEEPAEEPSEPASEPAVPEPSTTTLTFNGNLNAKHTTEQAHPVTAGAGELTAELVSKQGKDLRVELRDLQGNTLAVSDVGTGRLSNAVAAGDYVLVVTGSKGSYTLNVTLPVP